jgi:hypothetical protein
LEKMDKCLRYAKQWMLRCPPEKKRREKKMNTIAYVFLQSYFWIPKGRGMFFKGQSRIRFATIYISLIHSHTCTSWFDHMT